MPHCSPPELNGILEEIHLETGRIQLAGTQLELNEMTHVMNGVAHLRLIDLEVGQHVRVAGQQGRHDRHCAQEIKLQDPPCTEQHGTGLLGYRMVPAGRSARCGIACPVTETYRGCRHTNRYHTGYGK